MEFETAHLETSSQPEIKTAITLVLGGIGRLATEEKSILTRQEFVHYSKLIPAVRDQYLLGRYLAKKAIAIVNPNINPSEIQIDNGVWGFPIVKSKNIGNIQVSISHTNTAASAICFPEHYPMGIDIEAITTINMMIIKEELTNDEFLLHKQISISTEDFCLSAWTAKEALSKALKTGFRMPFNFFEISSFIKTGDLHLIRFKHFRQFTSLSTSICQHKISIVFPVELEIVVKNLILGIRRT